MQIKHLETFVAVVNAGGFTAAAAVVGLTQSAVSQQMRALEDDLGVVLFDREARPPRLTAQGRTLVDHARQVMALCQEAAVRVRGETMSGTLLLGVIRSGLVGLLPDALVNLRAGHPGVKVLVITGDLVDLLASVANNRLDVAIVPESVAVAEGLIWRPLFVEPFAVIAPAGTPGSTDKEVLESQPYIHFSRQVRASRMIEAELQRRAIRLNREMEIDSVPAIAMMVAHGLGVSIVPQQSIGRALPVTVRALPFGTPPLVRTIGMVERQFNPKANLIAALHGEVRRLSRIDAVAD